METNFQHRINIETPQRTNQLSQNQNSEHKEENIMKEVVLIRHGESEGQVARHQGLDRKDQRLLDCFLTPRGIQQALTLPPKLKQVGCARFQLVCTSPLTRAFATCCLGFCSKDSKQAILTLVHADLAEVGSSIPENTGRPISTMLRDVKRQLRNYPGAVAIADSIDCSLVPGSWPARTKGSIDNFLNWLQRRPESSIAIVCHQNVIQRLLHHTVDRVPNCAPVRCVMEEGSNSLRLMEGHHQALPPINTVNPTNQPCSNGWEPLRPVRLGLCSKLDQKKPDCVMFVEPVAGTIIQRAAKKYAWKGMNRKPSKRKQASKAQHAQSPQFIIRRVTDGRQATFVQDCGDVLDWLRDGDAVYVGPGLVSTVAEPFPVPPSLAVDNYVSLGGPSDFESLCPVESGSCSEKPPISKSLAPSSLPHNRFPLLESNVLEEIRAAVMGDKSFLEKRTLLPNMELSFLSFDYKQLHRDSLPDPNEGSHISGREKRRRALRRECRGLLLDPDTGQVVARRLHKFWNIGETFETTLSQLPSLDERCVLTEKVDGSLVSPFLAHGTLVWASKRVPHADASAHAEAHPCLSSFALYCITELDSTPIFEWVDPKRPIVVRYESPRLILIAVRHMRSGEYMPDVKMRELASKLSSVKSQEGGFDKIDVVPRLEIYLSQTKSVAELAERVASFGPGREGAVLRFSDDTFIKMKSEWYVTRHDRGLAGCGTSSVTLARLIKYQLPGPIKFTEIPVVAVLSASLARTIDDVIPMLKYQTSAAEKFKTFDDSVSHGLLELHERLLRWGRSIRQCVTGTKSDLNRRIEALSYTTNSNTTSFPWSAATLHLYARTGCPAANTDGSTGTLAGKAFASLRKDLRILISDATGTKILVKSLKADWPPQPEESLSFEAESLYSRTEGTVCLEQGIVWDSVLVDEPRGRCENGRRILAQLFSGTHTGRVAVVLRGLPGSGKSTVASKLLLIQNSGELCSADFYLQKDILKGHTEKQRGLEKKTGNGSYKFTKERLAEAHRLCFSQFQTACQNPTISLVVCDNTNITEREIVPYFEAAAAEDLELVVVEIVCKDEDHVLACQRRNIHLVDASTALRRFHQLKRWDAKYMPHLVLVRPGSVVDTEKADH